MLIKSKKCFLVISAKQNCTQWSMGCMVISYYQNRIFFKLFCMFDKVFQPVNELIKIHVTCVIDLRQCVTFYASLYKKEFILFQGKSNACWMKIPIILTQHTAVTIWSSPVLEIFEKVLFPFGFINFGSLLGTVEIPVSSILNFLRAGSIFFRQQFFRLL